MMWCFYDDLHNMLLLAIFRFLNPPFSVSINSMLLHKKYFKMTVLLNKKDSKIKGK